MSKVVTIIANYNYGWNIILCIKTALQQTYKNHIVVVVDDGSSDDSVQKILNEFKFESSSFQNNMTYYYSDKLLLITKENGGASEARNVGMDAVPDADFYHILDADDAVFDYKVSLMMEKMVDEDIGVVYGDYTIVSKNYTKREFKQSFSKEKLLRECIVHSGALIRKRHLDMVRLPVGYYDPALHGPASKGFIGCTEDYDLWLRLSNVCLFVHIPEILTQVLEHGANQSFKMNSAIFNNNMQVIFSR